MANKVQKTIDIIFNGTDNVSNVIGDIGDNLDSAGGSVKDFASPFESAATAVLALDAAMAALVVTGVMVSANIETEATKMKNALGLPTEEAEKFRDIATEVYAAGYGDDLAASFEAVTLAQQKFGDNAETDIGKVVTEASKLEKVFGIDYTASLGAAKTLMTNFGLSSDEAFDFVAAGYQKGLDGSGDFIESINEYSTQFANGGASADQFFSVMESGFQEGMLGTDRAADAFKEFRVRIQDGSKTTAEALDQIGLGDEFTDSLARGEISAIDAFGVVIQKLNDVDDSSIQMQAGVGLIGTQFEDLGTAAALALNTTQTDMDNLIGTMDNFDGATFEKKMTSAWRTALISVGELAIWDQIKDKVGDLAGDISINFADSISDIDTTQIEVKAEELFNIFAKFFEDAELDLTTAEGMDNAVKIIIESVESLINVTKGMAEIAVPVFEAVVEAIQDFNALDSDTKELVGNIVALGTALGVVGGALTVGGTLLGGLSSLTGLVSTGGLLATGLTGIITVLSGPVGLAAALTVAAVAVADFSFGQIEEDGKLAILAIEAQAEAVKELTDQIKELPIEVSTIEIFAAIETGDLEAAQDLIDDIVTAEYIAEIGTDTDTESVEDFQKRLYDLPDDILVGVELDKQGIVKTTETLEYELDGKLFTIEVPVEASGVEKVKEDIDGIPTEKQIEIKLQGEIDTQIALIKASAETAQESFKYTAEVDIVEAQEATKQIAAAFDSINASIESSAAVYSSAFEGAESSSVQARHEALDILNQEQELREQSFDLQKQLTEAQIAYTNARTEALEGGDAAITIDSTGLEPALEMILFEIMKKVQIRVNETAGDLLLT